MWNPLAALRLFFLGLRKSAQAFVDAFTPSGHVELVLRYAHGPMEGQVYRRIKGRNVVTGFLGEAYYSGRDMMRRMIVPSDFPGSLVATDDHVVHKCQLGTGTTAETSDDTSLVNGITPIREIYDVSFDVSHTWVTFIFQFEEDEANATLAEVALLSDTSPADFLARKTFNSFTKTNEFTLEVQWTIRF